MSKLLSLDKKIAVVIPAYRVRDHLQGVLGRIPEFVWRIYVVDDACPDGSGDVASGLGNPRVVVLRNPDNRGVGGAMITGYKQALRDGAGIIVKIDGDGQMNPELIPDFVIPILKGKADYTKGNRFFELEGVRSMPRLRLFGNAVLSFMTKLSSGYWSVFDPTNGYTAIHARALALLPLDKMAERYFFESDLLFRLGTVRAVVRDIPMGAVYGEERSNLVISRVLFPFLRGNFNNTVKRIFYMYFLRDFNVGSLQIVFGFFILCFGVVFGLDNWISFSKIGVPAPSGTVMLAAIPTVIGVQLLLSALQYDLTNQPEVPLSSDHE